MLGKSSALNFEMGRFSQAYCGRTFHFWRSRVAVVRYIVSNVESAVAFYTTVLGFELVNQQGPPFAMVKRDDLTLWLSGPGSSASRPLTDGSRPASGGWNRLVLETDDLEALVGKLTQSGTHFRSEIVSGPGGKQVLLNDPSGNPIELFEPRGR
jgi:catechol 2,3-dioxygenase-like lactoylglutathione lyase family enzyme